MSDAEFVEVAANEGDMEEPIQLVSIGEDQSLHMKPEALDFLRSLPQPIYIVTLAGVAREGKSTWLTLFMRHLAEKCGESESDLRFRVSKGVVTCTSGCWVWATSKMPGRDGTLVPMDTQGLASGNQEGLNRLFTFSVLLSSVLVLNVMRQVNDDTLDKLGAVAALSRLVQGDVSVFPKLYTLVRDFELSIEESGFDTLNAYLENLLEPEGSDERDATRASIRSIFKKRELLAMETPSKEDKKFLNSWNDDEGAQKGMPPTSDFVSSFKEAAESIFQAATENPKMLGSVYLGGDEIADLAQTIVSAINEKPVDLHSALHSIFDGVCRRAMLSSRDQVMDEMSALTSQLPIHNVELDNAFGEVKMKATKEYARRCEDAGVPEDDQTWEEHLSELNRMLDDKQQIIEQENERKILEHVAAVLHKYEDQLREKVDQLVSDPTNDEMIDLAFYIEKHDGIKEELWTEIKAEIKIASKDQIEEHQKKFEKLSRDIRSRNIDAVRIKLALEAEKKQKLMLALMGAFIMLAIGIDGDPFDEIFSVLRLLWFLPILCAGGAGYFFMYGTPPPYSMEAISTGYKVVNQIKEHVMVEEEKPKKE